MRIFVTGASGFLGRRVVERLLAQGHEVRALVRRPADYTAPAGVEIAEGSLHDLQPWQDALQGCGAVIHAAGIIETWGPWREFERSIVTATEDLLAAAERAGVQRFVAVSSESVLQAGRPLVDIDESAPEPAEPSSFYGMAKLLAERAVRAHSGAMETIVIRPTFIWGEDSAQLADLVQRARTRSLPLLDRGRALFEHVHVDNVADALCAAITRGRPGRVYFVTNGEAMPVSEFLHGILTAHGATVPTRSLPSKLLMPVAAVAEALWRGLHLPGRPPATRFELEFLSLPRRYRIDAARADLGYEPAVSFAEGVARLGTR